MLAIGSALYAEGWLIRLLESRQDSQAVHLMAAAQTLGARFGAVYLALCIALTAFGGFAFTIMNTSSVSAIKSLVTGEASRFQQDMLERQEYIRITDSDVTAVLQRAEPLARAITQRRRPFDMTAAFDVCSPVHTLCHST